MSLALIDIANQCCDADQYLDMGYQCAQLGNCYNSLRPIGDTLWFSIPYILNTSENILFYLHLFLLSLVFLTFFNLIKQQATTIKALPTTCAFLLILVFLIWPTFFYSLSDTPATLLFIEGILLACVGMTRNSPTSYFLAGISLGLSTLLRTAYFIPLLLAGILFLVYWLWQTLKPEARKCSSIFILSFIIPLSFQCFVTWKHTGQWHFVSEARSNNLMNFHLNSAAAGYDTQLPQTSVFWSPDCSPSNGLLANLKHSDFTGALCIFKNRLAFYLGSYAPRTYLGNPLRNFIDNDYAEKVGHSAGWSSQGMRSTLNAVLSPLNDQTASRLSVDVADNAEHFVQSKSLMPLPAGEYRYSIWLWTSANDPATTLEIQLSSVAVVRSNGTSSVLMNATQQHTISLTNAAQQYAFDINNTSTGSIVTRISVHGNGQAFNAWGAALEPAQTAKNYSREPQKINNIIGEDTNMANGNRIFSKSYLIINILIILVAIFYLLTLWLRTKSPVIVFIAALLFSACIQSLVIIPEQRYVQGILGVFWLLCILFFNEKFYKKNIIDAHK